MFNDVHYKQCLYVHNMYTVPRNNTFPLIIISFFKQTQQKTNYTTSTDPCACKGYNVRVL
jgi:hypothetical protein